MLAGDTKKRQSQMNDPALMNLIYGNPESGFLSPGHADKTD